MSAPCVVLVHGAFRGGWCFDRVRPLLQSAGATTHAPTLPPSDERPQDLNDYARAVADHLEAHDLRDVTLVGHSQGGIVVCAASQLCADRLRALVLLDAPVARHGERGYDLVPEAVLAQRPPEPAADAVYDPWPAQPGDHLSAEDAAWLNERLRPEPAAVALTPLVWNDPAALALPRHYLFCRHTPATFPCAHGRARLEQQGVPYEWLDAPHDVPVTHPGPLAEALLKLVR